MPSLRLPLLCWVALAAPAILYAQSGPPQLGKAPIAAIVKAMTLEEKVRLIVGTGLRFAGQGPVIGEADGRVPGAAGNTINISRLGIPGTVLSDGPAGVRIDAVRGGDSTKTYYATAWPVGTLLASSWDTALVKKVGAAFGEDIKEYGVDVILGPGMNIQRNPLNGRNFEYYSEDPMVSGLLAAAMVEGIQSKGVGTAIKHFAANNQESNRGSVNAILSERALREIYLRGFEIAVKNAQPWTVMSSYNKINGVYTSESGDLLTTILRNEWGFKGFVMTDWYGGRDRAAQVRAGNDLLMPGAQNQMDAILAALKNGSLDSALLDRNVEKVLTVLLKTPSFHKYSYTNRPDGPAHARIARKTAAEGMVLLKNEPAVLPLQGGKTLALFGNASYATIMGGTGSGEVHAAYTVSIVKGLQTKGFRIVGPLNEQYQQYIQQDQAAHPKKTPLTLGKPRLVPEWIPTDETITSAAENADVAIYTLCRNAGEGADRKVTNDFNLSDTEQTLIGKIAAAFHAREKKLIVVLNIGGPIETASWQDKADAILLVWQPGEEAGNAVADILSGAVDPSGKLAETFPLQYEDEPSAKDFPGTPAGNPEEVTYREGIYVGYRYFATFHVKPAFPFGFGLSYTHFSYSGLQLSAKRFEKQLTAAVTITNTGRRPGREVVQLYLHAPVGELDKPVEELKGFAKTRLLLPGQSQTVNFSLDTRALASFNTTKSAWIAEAGNYTVMIGASSEDIKARAAFALPADIVVERTHEALVPQVPIDELKPTNGGSQSEETVSIVKWFPRYDLRLANFRQPSLAFGPFARWWWPGNLVDTVELKREVDVLAEHGFGGVEIQPLNLFVPGGADVRAKVNTWDSPEYYQHLAAVMEEANRKSLTVDMTDGSGWPPGGPYLSIEDNFITLEWATIDTSGGDQLHLPVPTIANSTGVPAKLQALLAAKVLPTDGAEKTSTTRLDASSVLVLTPQVSHDSLDWAAPPGHWKLIAIWSRPSGERGMQALPTSGPVVNHFDSTKVSKNFDHLFGERTGLPQYYGHPLRAVFDDSYEFAVDRHFSVDFLQYFKEHRGYDITPWLPAELRMRYNYVSYMRPSGDMDFSFSSEDWRLRRDYDLTLSELFGLHFLQSSKDWTEARGLLHRTQAYGLNLDMMASAGLASIPETESMLGPEVNLKIMTSGGHLYNRPLISAESAVFSGRAYTMTPQKIRIAVDKLFAAGVNQVVFHGVPYRYTPPELGPEGWYPFSTPLIAAVNFSVNLGEGNIFWPFQQQVNAYITRTQYALRAGKPHADVLIYFPFMDVDGMPDNPEEVLTKGYLPGVEGPLPPSKDPRNAAKEAWAAQVYPVINALESNGLTWDWVNDASIQQFTLTARKNIEVRGNQYQALILAGDSIIELATASKIAELSAAGMKLLVTGTLPSHQPSYLDWKANDARTAEYMQAAIKPKNATYSPDAADAKAWVKSMQTPVRFINEFSFSRQAERDMADGSRVQFIWNKSDQWQTISLALAATYKYSYWLDAVDGSVQVNHGRMVSYRLAPYSSILLFASTGAAAFQNNSTTHRATDKTPALLSIDHWTLKADSISIPNRLLFDWRTDDQLKYSAATGVYSASFDLTKPPGSSRVYLDLGKVSFTAEVAVNGKPAGTVINAPYIVDITPLVVAGKNALTIRVTPSALNSYIGKAVSGDPQYKQFKKKEDQLMSAGLIGPVVIRSEKN